MNSEYVQYGCGWTAPQTWLNFDASPTLRFERLPLIGRLHSKNQGRFPRNVRYGDIIKGLPVRDDSCRAVYCSHVLEHLSLEDLAKALRNTYRILKNDGVFRLVIPDIEPHIRRYIEDRSEDAAITFMKESSLGKVRRNKGLRSFIIEWLGNSQHLWMWDYNSISVMLREAGFVNIRRAEFGDSPDRMFTEVEEKGRWDGCLGVECEKHVG